MRHKILMSIAALGGIIALSTMTPEKTAEQRSYDPPVPVAEIYGVDLQNERTALISQNGSTVPYVYSTDIDGVTWFVSENGTGGALHGTLASTTGEQMVPLLPSS